MWIYKINEEVMSTKIFLSSNNVFLQSDNSSVKITLFL